MLDFWPLRRWLADRLIGKQAYSKNVARHEFPYVAEPDSSTYSFNARAGTLYWEPFDQDANTRSPQETA